MCLSSHRTHRTTDCDVSCQLCHNYKEETPHCALTWPGREGPQLETVPHTQTLARTLGSDMEQALALSSRTIRSLATPTTVEQTQNNGHLLSTGAMPYVS